MGQFSFCLGTLDDLLQFEALASGYGGTVADDHSVVQTEFVALVMSQNFSTSLDTFSCHFVDHESGDSYSRCLIHATDFGHRTSERHGRHFVRAY